MSDYRTILVAYDFSEHARLALETAVDLATRFGSELHLIHVLQPPVYADLAFAGAAPTPLDLGAVRKGVADSLAEVARGTGGKVKIDTSVVEGASIADRIGEKAEEIGADLLVMGTHGRTGLAHAFLGSVAERTLRRSPCPVLTVRSAEDGD